MSVRRLTLIAIWLLLFLAGWRGSTANLNAKPKLVLGIVIDQFRYDYLTRFRSDYHGGIDEMLRNGADFTNAFYAHVPTVTAVGHSIFMSGAMPAVSGIIANAWYDRAEGQVVTSVCDWDVKVVGGSQDERGARCADSDPASPRRLLVSTVGDELRNADSGSKVIGISIKARGAILPSGHRAAGAYWFDDVTGNFVSSSFYMDALPGWAEEFNRDNLPGKYVEQKWEGFPNWSFRAPAGGKAPYAKLPASPWGNELIEKFAEKAITGERLGQRGPTDLLTISFSSNDYVGHVAGPDAPEVRDMSIRTDELLGRLFRVIDQTVGMKNVIVVLSADHGVAPTPAVDEANKMPGGYVLADVEDAVQSALNRKFGKAEWIIPGGGETAIYFNHEAIEKAKKTDGQPVTQAEIFGTAKETLLTIPQLHVARVYTREQLDNGIAGDFIARAEMNGYFPRRSGDVNLVFEPAYVPGTAGTTHFSPYAYDTHVPVLFLGPGIRPGHYDERIEPNDIAPTLATILEVQTPSGSSGRVLSEMLVR
ncbi:MAG: alkaline phosphatase family protein [Acidobacteriaceae bacterium]|nr:alkaline phosphatase family protein [Acidobacteriaceae bacterium]